MSLDMTTLQRAMLAEMGVRVWAPQAATDAAETPSIQAPPSRPLVASPTVAPTTTAPPPVIAADKATLDTDPASCGSSPSALCDAVRGCQACAQGAGRTAAVLPAVQPLRQCDWMVVGDNPDDAQERARQPFVGDAGILLDNMLRAVGVRRHDPELDAPAADRAYLTLVLKCRPALPAAPQFSELATCARYLCEEISLVRPKVIISMGRLAMQLLLSEDHPQGLTLPLGKLRGRIWHYQGVPVVVTYPPSYLLQHSPDKARAWQDLCLAADVVQGRSPDR